MSYGNNSLSTVANSGRVPVIHFAGGKKRSASPSGSRSTSRNRGPNRSVNDFENDDQLRKALLSFDTLLEDPECHSILHEIAEGEPVQKAARICDTRSNSAGDAVVAHMDWVLPNYDAATTEPQSMSHELHRLQVLRKYLVLDSEREQAFERITALASRIFDVPIALVSLVDLGRQWFMSNRGLGDVRETPRKMAFCSHAILSKSNILIVPDAHLDFRFVNNPLVTGPPYIRFYAGSPLASPEGFKLGTFCIIDSVPRPQGLTIEQQDTLKDLADMTVKVLVDRRFQLEKEQQSEAVAPAAQIMANTAHDLMTPLSGLQLSLSLLKEDEEVQSSLGENHLELLHTAVSCSDLMVRICENAVAGGSPSYGAPDSYSTTTSNGSFDNKRVQLGDPTSVCGTHRMSSSVAETHISHLVKSLTMILEPIATRVPLVIAVDPATPAVVLADDLKLFRGTLNFLTSAFQRTTVGTVRLTIRPVEDKLRFECEDTGTDICFEEYQFLFLPCHAGEQDSFGNNNSHLRLSLSSVATLIQSMDGEYGFHPRGINADGSLVHDSKGRPRSGSVFWFSIPLKVSQKEAASFPAQAGLTQHAEEADKLSIVDSSTAVTHRVNDAYQEGAIQVSFMSNSLATPMAGENISPPRHEMSLFTITGEDSKVKAKKEDINCEGMDMSSSVGRRRQRVSRRRRHALIIDDSLVIRKSLERALNKLGFEVSLAVDGMEGLEKLKETMYDLVLCDFLMPVLDGLDCVKQYRDWEEQNRSWFRQLIIGISAHANMKDSGQGRRAGMDDFRPKPITVKTLTELQESCECFLRTEQLDSLERDHRSNGIADEDILPQDGQAEHSGFGGAVLVREKACLLATDLSPALPNTLQQELQSHGWNIVAVSDGADCLTALQMRNWDVVLIDDDLPQIPGASCIMAFREWEEKNRVNRQKNVFLVCEGDIPSPDDKLAMVNLPKGCNGVIGRPVSWTNLQSLMRPKDGDRGMDIVVR